jgi:uncharacterized protein YwgA
VERTTRPLTTRDTVLLIVHAAGGHVGGRTVLQKLAYFCGLHLGAGFGHRPHYFGPYSSKVEDAATNAAVAGELHESVERVPDFWGSGSDVLKYSYDMTDAGEDRVTRLIDDYPEEWERIEGAVTAIQEVLPTLDQKTLSSAAKTYLIISESEGEEGVEESDIPNLAKRLGWNLSPAEVKNTIKLLEELDLVASGTDE